MATYKAAELCHVTHLACDLLQRESGVLRGTKQERRPSEWLSVSAILDALDHARM
ncbi:hypothetical protein BGC_01040 [Burkholderia sp. 3C]